VDNLRLALALALIAAPVALAEAPAPVRAEARGWDPLAPADLSSVACGGTAPAVKACVATFTLTSAGVVVTVSGCFTGDLTVTLRNTNLSQWPRGTKTVTLGLACGQVLGSTPSGDVFPGPVEARAETRTLFNLAGQDKGLGPWSVTYDY